MGLNLDKERLALILIVSFILMLACMNTKSLNPPHAGQTLTSLDNPKVTYSS